MFIGMFVNVHMDYYLCVCERVCVYVNKRVREGWKRPDEEKESAYLRWTEAEL